MGMRHPLSFFCVVASRDRSAAIAVAQAPPETVESASSMRPEPQGTTRAPATTSSTTSLPEPRSGAGRGRQQHQEPGDAPALRGSRGVSGGEFRFGEAHAGNDLTEWTTVDPPSVPLPPAPKALAPSPIAVARDAAPASDTGVVWAELSIAPRTTSPAVTAWSVRITCFGRQWNRRD